MSSVVQRLHKQNIPGFMPPPWLPNAVVYEVITGSYAYGVSSDTSDMDVVGFCIPKKETIFPHLAGEIEGFGIKKDRFNTWTQHHIVTDTKQYDLTIHSIVRYFQLCMENNPNMIDTLFVPPNCVLYSSAVGELVRDNRKLFLHKGCWHKFKGYAFSQLHKCELRTPKEGSKRSADVEKFGFDVKFAYHVVRLLVEVEQILQEGDLDLQRGKEQLKAIRAGEYSFEQIKSFFNEKEKYLEQLYQDSKLPYSPDEDAIKTVLLNCLESHYGSLEKRL